MAKSRHVMVLPITDFPFSPSTYVLRRPRFSFLFSHRGVYRSLLRAMNKLLAARHLIPVTNRIPVLAYGSNASQAVLLMRAARFGLDAPISSLLFLVSGSCSLVRR